MFGAACRAIAAVSPSTITKFLTIVADYVAGKNMNKKLLLQDDGKTQKIKEISIRFWV